MATGIKQTSKATGIKQTLKQTPIHSFKIMTHKYTTNGTFTDVKDVFNSVVLINNYIYPTRMTHLPWKGCSRFGPVPIGLVHWKRFS